MLKDPDYLQKLPNTPEIKLYKPTSTGGKFWRGAIVDAGVHITWGKFRTTGSSKLITSCAQNSPAQELLYRATRKLQNGYTIYAPDTCLPKYGR